MKKLSEFSIDYEFEGAQWSFKIFPKDKDEAQSRLDVFKSNAEIFGMVKA